MVRTEDSGYQVAHNLLEFISASMDAAVEYMRLGKVRRALAIYTHALPALQTPHVSKDIKTLFLLRHAEALAAKGRVVERSMVLSYLHTLANIIAVFKCTKKLEKLQI